MRREQRNIPRPSLRELDLLRRLTIAGANAVEAVERVSAVEDRTAAIEADVSTLSRVTTTLQAGTPGTKVTAAARAVVAVGRHSGITGPAKVVFRRE